MFSEKPLLSKGFHVMGRSDLPHLAGSAATNS